MRIRRVEVEQFDYRLEQPISISFHTYDHFENFLLRLYSDDGLIGWGEGAPFKPITHDAESEVFAEAAHLRVADMPELRSPEQFYDESVSRFACPTLRAALDQAAYDLVAQQRGVPAWRLLGERVRPVSNCITVFISDDPSAGRATAQRIFAQYPHLRTLKIKLKGSGDIERCRAIRDVAPAHVSFVLDANQAFADPDQAVATLGEIVRMLGTVLAIEQPCPDTDDEKMRHVSRHLKSAPIFADESCRNPDDLERIIAGQLAQGINIKLQKAGGITPAKRMAKRAADAGLRVMIGCMFEHAIAIAAGVHVAVTSPNVAFTDLDMDLELPLLFNDRCGFENGTRHPLPTTGFGLRTDEAKIAGLPEGSLRRGVVYRDEG